MAKARSGWNSEYAHKKMDIELDEVDLARLLRQNGLPADAPLRMEEAEELLYLSAEDYAKITLARFDPSLKDELARDIRELRKKRAGILDGIRERLTGAGGS